MEVVFLGTGNAFASGGRNHMAILLRGEGIGVLLDCGPTTLVALKRNGLGPQDVDVVLVSHLHGDHFGGIPMLAVHETYASRRTKPLGIFGPRGTRGVVTSTNELFFPGMGTDAASLSIHDLEAGEGEGKGETVGPLRFSAFEVEHFSSGPAYGYRAELGGKTVVFSGDTEWTDVLVRQTRDADLFICECSSFDEPVGKHMTHRALERNRERLGAKRTLLVHAGDDVIARESELIYELAQDGTRIDL